MYYELIFCTDYIFVYYFVYRERNNIIYILYIKYYFRKEKKFYRTESIYHFHKNINL